MSDTDARMRQAIRAVEAIFPGLGVAIVVFESERIGSTANYVGNTTRGEMRTALGEVIQRWDDADRQRR